MDIRSYLKQAGHGAGVRVAGRVGVHPVMVAQWANGKKRVPVERCTAIEAATEGEVRRWDLRPNDWFIHWPELIGTEGAPDVPVTSEGGGA